MMENEAAGKPTEDLTGVPEWAKPVAEHFGRVVFELAYRAGIGRQAASDATEIMQRHASRKGLTAVLQLAQAFNVLGDLLIKGNGVTPEQLAECDAAIRRAWEDRDTGRVQLLH